MEERNKVFIGIFLGVFLALICPIMINEYFEPRNTSDAISYYGTLLGATATIIAVTWTIKTTKESAEKDRKHAELINHRNIGIKACFDLIESCDSIKIHSLLETLNESITKKGFDKNIEKTILQIRLRKISESIKIKHIYFQFIYPLIGIKTKDFIDCYVMRIQEDIDRLSNSLEFYGTYFGPNNDILDEIIEFKKEIEPAFLNILQNLNQEYDCETYWEYPEL